MKTYEYNRFVLLGNTYIHLNILKTISLFCMKTKINLLNSNLAVITFSKATALNSPVLRALQKAGAL